MEALGEQREEEEGLPPSDLFLLRSASWRAELLDRRDAARVAGSHHISQELFHLGELCRLCTHALQAHAEAAAGRALSGVPDGDRAAACARLRAALDLEGPAQLRERWLAAGRGAARPGEEAAERLLLEGYCVLRSAASAQQLEAASAALARQRKWLAQQLEERLGQPDLGVVRECGRVGFREVTSRAENHFDLQLEGLEAALGLQGESPAWLPAVEAALGGEAQVRISGVFLALPASEPQEWHADGPHRDCEVHARPYAVNVLLPLVSLAGEAGARRGPPELLPASHLLWRARLGARRPAPEAEELSQVRVPELELGDALLFDHRLLHRAGANCSGEERPVAYLTYCRASDPWVDPNLLDRVPLRLAGRLLDRLPSSLEEIDE